MSSVTFSTTVGGDGSTVTDDDDATTGLRNGGWRTRFVPALAQEVAVAGNAVASATAALSSKNAAAASASAASASESAASTSETNAANSATAAAASYDSFDDRYLGVKTSDPSVDNDGNALLVGALYWNSATSVFKVWSGSVWITNLTSNQFGTNVATFLQTPSSANLAAALTDETGTAGKVVFDTNPTFPAQINLTANSGYNIYASGSAENYLAGGLGVGASIYGGVSFRVAKTITGATYPTAILSDGTIQSDVTGQAYYFQAATSTAATSFTTNVSLYLAKQNTIGAGSTITNQYGFNVDNSLIGATNNYGFYGGIAAGANRYNLYMGGSAVNAFSGDVNIFGAGKLGYTTGSGGAVTQATSRTTSVTINKTNGAITLVSAAGSAIYQSFTVTNSTVAATDTIIVNQKSGTDKYIILVTNVAAGSFQITFATTGGLTTEQPIFNFALIKAVNA